MNRVVDLFAAVLTDLGFGIERRPLPGRGDQLTARQVLGEGKRLLVLGHADTVLAGGRRRRLNVRQ